VKNVELSEERVLSELSVKTQSISRSRVDSACFKAFRYHLLAILQQKYAFI
jgi:hypothetical protein